MSLLLYDSVNLHKVTVLHEVCRVVLFMSDFVIFYSYIKDMFFDATATAEKRTTIVWQLSNRENAIVDSL